MRITILLTTLIWIVLFMGCPKQKEDKYCYKPTPFDSLISLGDSAIRVLSLKRVEEEGYRDSIHNKLDNVSEDSYNTIEGYKARLQETSHQRVKRKDTVIHIKKYKYDTLYRKIEVILMDTIYKDTIIYNSIFKRKLF